jgi:hypothetical protein
MGGISAEDLAELKKRLPGGGHDGGVERPVCTQRSYTCTATGETKDALFELVCKLCRLRGQFNLSKATIDGVLNILGTTELLAKEARASIPTSHDGMLRAMETMGVILPIEVVYDVCPKCFLIYRNQYTDLENCPTYALPPRQVTTHYTDPTKCNIAMIH